MYSLNNTSLTRFECSNNDLSFLPTLPNSVKYMDISNNTSISSLSSLPTSLQYFDCSNTNILTIPLLPPTLSVFLCNNNTSLTSLTQPLPTGISVMKISNNTNFNGSIGLFPLSMSVFVSDYTPISSIIIDPTITYITTMSMYSSSLSQDNMHFICYALSASSINSGSLDIRGNGVPFSITINDYIIPLGLYRSWNILYDY
jgi:hypothetical protein